MRIITAKRHRPPPANCCSRIKVFITGIYGASDTVDWNKGESFNIPGTDYQIADELIAECYDGVDGRGRIRRCQESFLVDFSLYLVIIWRYGQTQANHEGPYCLSRTEPCERSVTHLQKAAGFRGV